MQDVAQVLGVSEQRARQLEGCRLQPTAEQLRLLAHHWGVSKAWLMCLPGAEMDAPEVRRAKFALREYLLEHEAEFGTISICSGRAEQVIGFLNQLEPKFFSQERIAHRLLLTVNEMRQMANGFMPDSVLWGVSELSGIPVAWFYQPVADLRKAELEPDLPLRLPSPPRGPIIF